MKKTFVPFDELAGVVGQWRARNPDKKLTLCHGCFDIVHPGHIRHLRSAAENGDFLVVSITPDACVGKGLGRPFVPEDLRVENLTALNFVNLVTIAPAETAVEVIETLVPDVYVKGNEYAQSSDPRFLKEKKLVESHGGKIVYTSGDVVYSSTEIIKSYNLDTVNLDKIKYICSRYEISRPLLGAMLDGAAARRVLVLGEALVDEFKHCEGLGISPDFPVLSLSLKRVEHRVGGAAMTAVHLASLGAKVTFLTSVATEDPNFPFFSGFLAASNVELVNIADSRRPMVLKSRYMIGNNKVLEVENDAYRPLDSKRRNGLLNKLLGMVKEGVDCLVYSDFGYGLIAEPIINEAAEFAKRHNTMVVGDLSTTLRTQIGKFYHADVFLPSEMELRACFHDYESGLSVLVDRLYQVTNIAELYLSLNDRSVMFFRRPVKRGVSNMETIHIPPLSKSCEDKIGLNDAFLVGITLGRVFGAEQVQSLYLGAVCSAVHGLRLGNHPLNKEEIHHFLDERPELR